MTSSSHRDSDTRQWSSNNSWRLVPSSGVGQAAPSAAPIVSWAIKGTAADRFGTTHASLDSAHHAAPANEGRTGPFDRGLYRLRNRIARLINRCKQFRRLATRDEKRAANFKAMWLIAATISWVGVI